MIVLVCGGREYDDKERLYQVLDRIASKVEIEVVVHGAARGADVLAGFWAADRGVEVRIHPADWIRYGKRAGYLRNMEMLEEHPDLIVAFPGGKGTANMVRLARKAGVPVIDFSRGFRKN
jgi:predicted Rossmann-fold nucleotide-binding protein